MDILWTLNEKWNLSHKFVGLWETMLYSIMLADQFFIFSSWLNLNGKFQIYWKVDYYIWEIQQVKVNGELHTWNGEHTNSQIKHKNILEKDRDYSTWLTEKVFIRQNIIFTMSEHIMGYWFVVSVTSKYFLRLFSLDVIHTTDKICPLSFPHGISIKLVLLTSL